MERKVVVFEFFDAGYKAVAWLSQCSGLWAGIPMDTQWDMVLQFDKHGIATIFGQDGVLYTAGRE